MANLQDYVILFLIWLISFTMVRALFTKYRTRVRRPPGPLALPIIGHFHFFNPSVPHQTLHKLSLRYGSVFQLFLGSIPCVVVSSPGMAKEFLQTREIYFPNRPKFGHADYLTYGSADLVCRRYGPTWRFMKNISMTKLLSRQTLEKFFTIYERRETSIFGDTRRKS